MKMSKNIELDTSTGDHFESEQRKYFLQNSPPTDFFKKRKIQQLKFYEIIEKKEKK